MKKNKIAILYFIATISYFLSATINFYNQGIAMGAIQLVAGAAFFCLALRNSKGKKE